MLLALTLLGLGAAAAWLIADRVATVLLVPAPYGLQPEFEVSRFTPHGCDPHEGLVVLPLPVPRRGDVPQFARTAARGRYALLWDDGGTLGHGLLGPVAAHDAVSVSRPLRVLQGAAPSAGAPARLDTTIFRRDPLRDHGLPFEDVRIDGPAGAVAAWWIDRGSDRAVVMLHGRRRGDRTEALRALPAVAAQGVSVLIASYRNHDQSDPSPDGLFHYGADEADDLLAALAWLRERRVQDVALVTYSMGGALALVARQRWPAAGPALLGIAMDAPLLDPRVVATRRVQRAGFPRLAAALGLALAARRTGVDFAALDLRRLAPTLDVPLLVQMTADDGTIPVALVDDFAARVPARRLSYRRLDEGDHVEAWNVDPDGYERALGDFLAGALARPARSGPETPAPGAAPVRRP